jgi:hypothetical protein
MILYYFSPNTTFILQNQLLPSVEVQSKLQHVTITSSTTWYLSLCHIRTLDAMSAASSLELKLSSSYSTSLVSKNKSDLLNYQYSEICEYYYKTV